MHCISMTLQVSSKGRAWEKQRQKIYRVLAFVDEKQYIQSLALTQEKNATKWSFIYL